MKLNSRWTALGWVATAQLIGKCRQAAQETLQIYGAAAYLKGVHLIREFLLHQIGILACVLFLVCGTLLMEGAAIFCISEKTSRLIALFAAGGLNFAGGFFFLAYFVSSKRWLQKAARYNAYLEKFLSEKPSEWRHGRIVSRRRDTCTEF